ncbi:MAG: hypothetical protein QXT13_08555 [Pyrobaculum sp.]
MSAYNVLKKAIEIEYKINTIRYKFARKVLEKLRQRKSKLLSVNISDYPAFVWNDLVEADIFLTPPSLSGHVEGWLAQPKFNIIGKKIIDVNWDELWTSLKPEFIYYRDVLDSIRNLMSYIINMSFKEDDEITAYAGIALYGNYYGFYKIAQEGIVVEYYDTILNKTLREVVAILDGQGCNVRNVLNSLIMDSSKIRYKCVNDPNAPEYETDYAPGMCGSLDQVITYIRQFLDKTLFCIVGSPRELLFVDGPLEGFVITGIRDGDVIWYSESGSGIININTIREMYSHAKTACTEMMKMRICPYLPGGHNYPT